MSVSFNDLDDFPEPLTFLNGNQYAQRVLSKIICFGSQIITLEEVKQQSKMQRNFKLMHVQFEYTKMIIGWLKRVDMFERDNAWFTMNDMI